MVLVIEAFEVDKKTNIVYSAKQEVEANVEGYVSLKRQRYLGMVADRLVAEVKHKQKAAAKFAKTAEDK